MSPQCQNCGTAVTERYAAVFSPDSVDGVRCCPFCEDKIRSGAAVRDARAPRSESGNAETEHTRDSVGGGVDAD